MENSQPRFIVYTDLHLIYLFSSNDSEDADQLVKEALKPPMNDPPRELRDEEKESSESLPPPSPPLSQSLLLGGSPPDPSEGSNRASNVSVKFIQVQAKRVD